MCKSKEILGRIGDIQGDIETEIYKHLRKNKGLGEEYYMFSSGQVQLEIGVDDRGSNCIFVISSILGRVKLRTLYIEEQVTILEQIEEKVNI